MINVINDMILKDIIFKLMMMVGEEKACVSMKNKIIWIGQ
ncbi:protein of unknown function [Xenorhabdus nematophila AN6/1]|nr:protein of unknown function [Xenorhabdus nematophila AN6/1]